MKKDAGIIIITAAFALLLWAGCAVQEDEVIDITLSEPAGTATPRAEARPEAAEKTPNGGEDQRYAAFTVSKNGLLQFEYGKWDTVGRGAGYVEKALTAISYDTDEEICLQVYWPAYESEATGRLEETTAVVRLRVKNIDDEEIDVQVGDEEWLLGVYGGMTSEEAYIANQN